MFTVFLADDEYMILEGLKRLFNWEEAGFKVVGEASDGDEAYEAIKRLKPDIVLTDIRMSGLCGLDLIKAVKEDGLQCKFIIISGYDDFSYCLEALRLGVSDYILKPIDFTTIRSKLDKAASTINGEKAEKEATSAIIKIAEDATRLKLNRFFTAVFDCSEEQKELAASISNEELPGSYYYCVCVADGYGTVRLLPRSERYEDFADYLYYLMFSDRHVFVLGFASRSGAMSRIREFALKLKSDMEVETSGKVSLGIGPLCTLASIHDSFRQAVNTVDYEVFYQMPVENIKPVPIFDSRMESCLKMKINNLVNAVKLADHNRADEAENSLFCFAAESRMSRSHAESVLNEISVLINNTLYELGNEYAGLNADSADKLPGGFIMPGFETHSLRTLDSCRKALNSAIHKSIENISRIYENQRDPLTKVKEYINRHYMEDLSLKSLAEVFHLNPSYLSRQFKEKNNVNYSDYLNIVRIEKSKKLLMSSLMSINEISEAVGFSDYRYFTKVFKRYQGMSPQAYKKNSPKPCS